MHIIWKLLLAVVICWLLNTIFVKPILKLLSYRRKGAVMNYFPIIGIFYRNLKDAKKYNDFFQFQKNIIKTKPDLKAFVTNFGSNVVFNCVDPALAKDVLQNYHRYVKGKMM